MNCQAFPNQENVSTAKFQPYQKLHNICVVSCLSERSKSKFINTSVIESAKNLAFNLVFQFIHSIYVYKSFPKLF